MTEIPSKKARIDEEDFPLINNVLPPEILKKILEWLDIKNLINARLTCKRWKLIIDNCNIMEEALSKISMSNYSKDFAGSKSYILHEFLSFSEKIHCIVIAGGYDECSVKVLTGDFGTKQLSNWPEERISQSSMVLHNGTILLCGGSEKNLTKCLQLDHGTWKEHSTLNKERRIHSAVTTQTVTFVFLRKTYEYLPNDSSTWLKGKTNIPGGFWAGCAIAVKSDQEIWLIGGDTSVKRILSFNVKDHTFQVLFDTTQELPSQLNVGRTNHRSSFIPNTNIIMITGGYKGGGEYLVSTETLDTEDGSVTMASSMNFEKFGYGIGVVTINDKEILAVFGGSTDGRRTDSVEVYNTQTGEWENTNIRLKGAKSGFDFLSVKLADVIPHL